MNDRERQELERNVEREVRIIEHITTKLWKNIVDGDATIDVVRKAIADGYVQGFVAGVESEMQNIEKIGFEDKWR